jgi:hypothetical protein
MIAPPKPPSHDDLEALIKEARERQLRRRLLGAAAAAVAATLGLGIYASVTGGNPANLAQPPAQGGRATGPACRASQLSVAIFFQGATQSMLGGATVTNTGQAACSLPVTRPDVRITLHGKRLQVREQSMTGSSLPTWKSARALAPNAKAEVLMDWGRLNWECGTSSRPTPRFVLRFASGLKVSGIAGGLTLPTCGLRASTIAVSRPLHEQ